MFKMRRSLLPVILVTTITLSSSNVLPILSISKLNTEPLLDDQDSDNTFNNKHTNVNPNIFYKVFIETPKANPLKKSQLLRSNYMDNDNQDAKILNGKIDNEDNDDEGFRKEQWHNYPRQLDRLNRNFNAQKEFDKILLDTKDLENLKRIEDSHDNLNQFMHDDAESIGTDTIDGPLLILKIRLAYLNNNINDVDSNNYLYSDLVPLESNTDITKDNVREENVFNENDIESLVKVKRKMKSRNQDFAFLENSTNDKKTVKKRIFSLWSRLQSLSHRGHELHHRRHLYTLYGSPEDGGGTLTAETRGTMMRPPGSPLRWVGSLLLKFGIYFLKCCFNNNAVYKYMSRFTGETRTILYGFWLSSCTWRVRVALAVKQIPFEEKPIDIVKQRTQLTDEYRAINPSQKVPTLVIDNTTLVESMAILQYLEETRPTPSLVPNTPLLRARMREICATIVSGIQPLQNVGLKSHFSSAEQYTNFTKYWTERGLQTLEDLLPRTAGRFCVEDKLSMADLCLVPQLYNAVSRHQLSLEAYPVVSKLYQTLLKEKSFSDTHPEKIKQRRITN
ncbi:uncharacterized protein LOC123864723 [Maniola jurtina]|uniref:uncharacterized protein LOC123864723 n=1 Tax=Maniola jurtina TaxID=191418 RepID=UPI001E68F47B|nr:uncharacterized protein LOC123864723 [Maniola jurtina]